MRSTFLVGLALVSTPALAEFSIALTASEPQIGSEDLVELKVAVTDPPLGVTIEWPRSSDFTALERTSRSHAKGKEATALLDRKEAPGAKLLRAVRAR